MEGWNREAGILEYPPSPATAAEASVFAEVYPPLAAPKATRATPDKMAVMRLRRTGLVRRILDAGHPEKRRPEDPSEMVLTQFHGASRRRKGQEIWNDGKKDTGS